LKKTSAFAFFVKTASSRDKIEIKAGYNTLPEAASLANGQRRRHSAAIWLIMVDELATHSEMIARAPVTGPAVADPLCEAM
jgi:hypothetical protein